MGRLILAIIAFAMAMMVLKMLLVAIVLAGLIFRTKVTVTLLLAGGFMTLLAAQPLIGFGLLALIGIAAFIKNGQNTNKSSGPDQALLESEDDPNSD